MKKRKCNKRQFKKVKISKIESTDEKLTSRGGLFFLNEYMENTGIISRLSHKFKYLKGSTKGIEQMVLDIARSDRIIYTNIGVNPELDLGLRKLTKEDYFSAEYIIKLHHIRATDELVNRDLKDFMTKEKLPFRAFSSNQVFYYLMTIAFSVMRIFQRTISTDSLYSNSQPNSFRRQFIDIPGKIIFHSGQKILKIAKAYFEKLRLGVIYERCKLVTICIPYY
jgi:hypothetical protein